MHLLMVKKNKYRAHTVKAYVYEKISNAKIGEDIKIDLIKNMKGVETPIANMRMAINKVCQETGMKVKTNFDWGVLTAVRYK